MVAKTKGMVLRVSNWQDESKANKTTVTMLTYDKKDNMGYFNPAIHKLTRDESDFVHLDVGFEYDCTFDVVRKGNELALRLTGVSYE